jgi:DNA-binding IclR family transcriptional regulator
MKVSIMQPAYLPWLGYLDKMARDRPAVDALLEEVRAKGYAVTGSILGDRGRGMAVPIRVQRNVVGAVTMRHYKTTMSEAEAAKRYLGPLQDLANAIAQRLSQPIRRERAVKPAPRKLKKT